MVTWHGRGSGAAAASAAAAGGAPPVGLPGGATLPLSESPTLVLHRVLCAGYVRHGKARASSGARHEDVDAVDGDDLVEGRRDRRRVLEQHHGEHLVVDDAVEVRDPRTLPSRGR